jgi:hypothetical protein
MAVSIFGGKHRMSIGVGRIPPRAVALFCIALLAVCDGPAWLLAQDAAAPDSQPDAPPLAPEQLDSLVSPIALYADPLIAQILAAATYPLDVVEANRWLQANPNLTGTALTDAAQQQNWDPSVQALIVFPSVVQMMDKNLKWTTDLGNAFLAQEQDVMDAVQRQRQRASDSGKLVSSPQENVQTSDQNGKQVIVIQPAQPEVIYVPVYNPATIWGPPIYNPWPVFWYPPRPPTAIIGGGIFSFWFGIPVSRYFRQWGGWNSWGWGCDWGSRTIVINNNFYIRNTYRVPNNVFRNGVSTWVHNPRYRAGVPYSNRRVATRFGIPAGNRRPAARPSPAARPRPGTRPAPGNEGKPQTRPTRPQGVRDRSAFGNMQPGNRTRIETDRGYSSLGKRAPARPAPTARPAPGARPARGAKPAEGRRQR